MPYTPMELAHAFIKTGELDDALAALNQQLEAAPDDHNARRIRVQVLLRFDDRAKLQRALLDIAALPEQTKTDHAQASVVQERLGAMDAAIDAAKTALAMDTADERLTERLLDLYSKTAQRDAALELVRQQPRNWRWLEREGDILADMGNDVLAVARYGLVLAQLDDLADTLRPDYLNALKARVLLARAHAYRRMEQIDIAREHYEAAQSVLPDDPTIAFNLGALKMLEGATQDAISQCQAALQAAPQALQQEMRRSLNADARYQALSDAL